MDRRNPKSVFIGLAYTGGAAPSRIEQVITNLFGERGYEVHTGREAVLGSLGTELRRLIGQCTVGVVIINDHRDNIFYEWGLMDALEMPVVVFKNSNVRYEIERDLSDKAGTTWIGYLGDAEDSEAIHKAILRHPGLPGLWKRVEEEVAKRMVPPGGQVTPELSEAARRLEAAPVPTGAAAPRASMEEAASQRPPVPDELLRLLEQAREKLSPDGLLYLGNAAWEAARSSADPQPLLSQAIAAYAEALRFYTPQAAPLDYAMTQNNLGVAHANLAAHGEPEANLQKAIAAYSEALRFYTPQAAPLNYAATRNNLGEAYRDLAAHGEPEANLQKAIAAYAEALVIFDREGSGNARTAARNLRLLERRLGPQRFQQLLAQATPGVAATPGQITAAMDRHAP